MKKKKIGITGARGSLGRILIKQNPGIKFICFKGDIRNRLKVKKWVLDNEFDTIIHLAAIVPIKTVNQNKRKALQVNFDGTKYLVDAILKSKIKWFFFASTSHVYRSSKKKYLKIFQKNPHLIMEKQSY